jgi:hypothetical protein
MQYTFIREGILELVDEELWQWEAHYNDGKILKQFADDGIFHQFREIDQERLNVFKMVSKSLPFSFTLLFDPEEMKLIHYYKTFRLNIGTEQESKIKAYCFGYEKNINGLNQTVNVVINPSNEIIICEDSNLINYA